MCDDKKKTTMILGGKKTLTFTAHSLNWKKKWSYWGFTTQRRLIVNLQRRDLLWSQT